MISTFRNGEQLRDAAHAKLVAYRSAIIRRGQTALLNTLLEKGTADDVRAAIVLPPDIDPVCLGAVPGTLAKAHIIERVGFVPSARAGAHARPVSVWRLRDDVKARNWLREHPALAEPSTSSESKAQRLLPLGGASEPER